MTDKERKEIQRSVSKYDLNVTFKCTQCKKNNKISFDSLGFYNDSSDCECCGSHGSSEITFSCRHCNQYFEIVDSW